MLDIAAVMVPLTLVQSVLNKTARHHCGFPFLPLQTQIAGAASGAVQPLAFKQSARNTLPKQKLVAWRLRRRAAPPQSVPAADPEPGITEPEFPPGEALPSLQTARCSPTGRVPRTSVSQA